MTLYCDLSFPHLSFIWVVDFDSNFAYFQPCLLFTEDYTQTSTTNDDSDFDPRLPSSNSHSSGSAGSTGSGAGNGRVGAERGTESLDTNGNILHHFPTTVNLTESVKNETYVIQELDRIVKLFRYATNRGYQ